MRTTTCGRCALSGHNRCQCQDHETEGIRVMTNSTGMVAFHGDPAIKEKYLTRVREHAAADQIVQGIYWENGMGCAADLE